MKTGVYIFDTETADKKNPEIIEAAWIKAKPVQDLAGESDRIDIGTFYGPVIKRFKPLGNITTGAIAVHGILPEELEGMPPSTEFRLPDDCAYIIGHSIDFDWEAAGRPDVKRICTHAMAQWVYPEATGFSLVALIYHIRGCSPATRDMVRNAHSAGHDCYLATLLLSDILCQRPEIQTWSALHAFSEECRIPRTCPMKRYEGVPLEELDSGFIRWCLNQDWLDPYFRIGLVRVLDKRYARDNRPVAAGVPDDDDVEDDDRVPF